MLVKCTNVDLAIFLASGFSGVEGLGLGFSLAGPSTKTTFLPE